MTHEFILSSTIFKRLTSGGYPLTCEKCEKPLQIGDRIISRHDHNRAKCYHKECWDSLFGIFWQPKTKWIRKPKLMKA